jgi:hypothetical protein
LTNRKHEISKILKLFNLIQGNNKFDVNSLISIIKVLSLNASILNEDIKKVLLNFVNESGVESNKLNEEILKLKEELTKFEEKENNEIFFKFKEEILESIESLKI